MTVTSLIASKNTHCKTHPSYVNLGVPLRTSEKTHKLHARGQASSSGIRTDVTVVLEVRQTLVSARTARVQLQGVPTCFPPIPLRFGVFLELHVQGFYLENIGLLSSYEKNAELACYNPTPSCSLLKLAEIMRLKFIHAQK